MLIVQAASSLDARRCAVKEKWSDEEHTRFVEAIEMYGRDWGKIVAHIGTRTVAQVRFLSLMARQLSEGVLSASQLLKPGQTLPAEAKRFFGASSRKYELQR